MTLTKTIAILILFFTIHQTFSQDYNKKWKLSFQLDNRFSSIKDNNVTIFGAKIGVQYKNLTRFGIGGSLIINPVTIEYFNKRDRKNETNIINLWYGSFFNDWILFKNDRWECFVTEQIGFGKPDLVREVNDAIVSDIYINLYVNEASAQVNYKILNWLGAGIGYGYRNILNENDKFKNTFNAPIYIAKIIIYPESFVNTK